MIWSLRSLAKSIEIAMGLALEQEREETFAGSMGYDISALPIQKIKASTRPRDPRKLKRIVVHVTAVRGGFGVRRARVEHWLKPSAAIPEDIKRQLPAGSRVDWARRLALWERYRDVPYHQIAAQNGDVIQNRPLSQRSYHAGAGNDGAGFAVDCAHDEELSDFLIETGRAGLRRLCERVLDVSTVPPILVAPHRAFTRQRVNDTSANVWREIVKPTVAALPDVLIDYKIKRSSGRPVPNTWDDDALFDAKGRTL